MRVCRRYKYDLGPDAPIPLVARCCIVETTRGNRRLGTHVLGGLERLLPAVVKPSMAKVAAALAAAGVFEGRLALSPRPRFDPFSMSHGSTITHCG